MRHLALVTIPLLAALVISGCQNEEPQAAAGAAPEVTVSTPVVMPIADWDGFVGQFEAVEQVELRPRVSGYLVDVSFREGELVEAGGLLFQVDARPFEATLDEANSRLLAAKARLDQAETEFSRAADLIKTNAISVESHDSLKSAALTAEADVAAAEAAVRSAELNVEFTQVRAPISGRVSYRRVDVGNAVRADDTLLTTITSVDPIQFVFQSSEALFLKYKRQNLGANGTAPLVRIRLQDETEAGWTGSLDFMDNAMNASAGTITGRAIVSNPDGFLTPGMFGHMELRSSDEYAGILLPDAAIVTRGAQRIVYVVNDEGVVSAREVQLGDLQSGLRVIRAGLEANDRVVINGQQRARPGLQVNAIAGSIDIPENMSQPAEALTEQPNELVQAARL